jgi:hypothetical protein
LATRGQRAIGRVDTGRTEGPVEEISRKECLQVYSIRDFDIKRFIEEGIPYGPGYLKNPG